MHISEVEKYRKEKDHHMRLGHLSAVDRDSMAYHRGGFMDKEAKDYHSPERHGDMNAHGVELE